MEKPKILIVDDEPLNVDYLEQELEELNYAITTAVNGQEALDKTRLIVPDLILLDIMMPVMDGFEVLTRLKANPATREIPVIVISALSDLKNVVKGIQLGAEDYLPKPFDPVLLHARLSSCLEKKRLRDIQQLYLQSLEREMTIARDIQKDFLPSQLPEVEGWELAARFKAAREVTGDFYDAFILPDGNLFCVIGDVCDKGIGAALYMTLFRSLIRATATSDVTCSGVDLKTLSHADMLLRVITFTNQYVVENHSEAGVFATAFLSVFNLADGKLTYANCGNEPALLRGRGQAVIELAPTGPVLGVIKDAKFSVRDCVLEQDDLFLVFTDGVPDSKNTSDVFFGRGSMAGMVTGWEAQPGGLLDSILAKLDQFKGNADQFDDITLLAVKRLK